MKAVVPVAPAEVIWITRTLEEAGFATWAVGGAVRDALRGCPSGDWDLATRATPGEVRGLFKRTVPIGVEHGTVGILARDGVMYETTTFRKDVETDGRHAIVEFASSIEDDLARRDFTVNAIAWHPLREQVLDPFSGGADLEHGLLRTVGDPRERFQEDYLRILRALRFAGCLELEIESSTWAALCNLVEHLTTLSAERIRDELMKVFSVDPHPRRALELYGESGALRVLYGELEAVRTAGGLTRPASSPTDSVRGGWSWACSLGAVERISKEHVDLRLAALLRVLEPDAAVAVLMRLRMSNARADEIALLVGVPPLPSEGASEVAVREWLSTHGAVRLRPVTRLELAAARGTWDSGGPAECHAVVAAWRRAREVLRSAPPLTVGDLALDGRGLIRLGLKPGPTFGEILEDLLQWVLEDPARNDESVLETRALEWTRGTKGDV